MKRLASPLLSAFLLTSACTVASDGNSVRGDLDVDGDDDDDEPADDDVPADDDDVPTDDDSDDDDEPADDDVPADDDDVPTDDDSDADDEPADDDETDAGNEASDDAGAPAETDASTDTDAGSAETDAGTAPLCEEAYSVCQDGESIAYCAGEGAEEVTFTCTDGCDPNTDECNPTALDTGWFVHQFQLADDSIQTPASYTFEENGLVAIQTANPLASAYVKDQVLSNVLVQGSISVTTSSDDDYFGFVFGWQDPSHFYLLDWKQIQQNDSTCGLAEEGFVLKLVNSNEELVNCADVWATAGTDKVTPLSSVADNPTGWGDSVVYDFTLVHKPGDIQITIAREGQIVAEVISDDNTYSEGLFGFYNYSQEGVRYEFFSINPAP